MSRYFPGRQARWVAVLLLLPVVVLIGAWTVILTSKVWEMAEVRAEIAPRYARLSGIQSRGDDMVAAQRAAEAWLSRRAYPAAADTGEIGTELQQRLRQLAESAELRVAGSQILPTREEQDFSVITVSGSLEGSTGALATFLHTLATEEPPIMVEKLAVQAPRSRRRGEESADVNAQATMSVLRLLR